MSFFGGSIPELTPFLVAAGAVFLRLAGFVLAVPFFSNRAVSTRLRALFVLHTTICVYLSLGLPQADAYHLQNVVGMTAYLIPEFLLGLALGLIVRVVFNFAEGMGQMVSFAIGLGFATFVDPGTGTDTSAVGQFLATTALLLFVASGAHLWVLGAFFDSYAIMPIGSTPDIAATGAELSTLGQRYFEVSLRLAAPVMALGLMFYVVLAVIAKVSPQLNLFAIGFAIIIPSGLAMVFIELPDFATIFLDEFGRLPHVLREFAATGRIE